MNRIPVTLVTGFLGAGKTTLLNHVLGAGSGLRFAVIENEFGDVGMDGALVNSGCAALFELNDGCICCSVREDLIEVFEALAQRIDEVDHVIIETTGLAEPEPVLRVFERPEVRAYFSLNGVVTVVDAAHLESSLDDVSACQEQVAYADLLLLNKTDCASALQLDALEAQLAAINPVASIRRVQHSKIELPLFLSIEGRADAQWKQPATQANTGDHGHDHDHDHDHEHDESIQSVVIEGVGDVDVAALDLWLGVKTRRSDALILRMKGVIAVPGDERRFILNGVRRTVDVRPGQPWLNDNRMCRIVFIGRHLDAVTLQDELRSCMLAPTA